ncbi:MAG: deoxyribodipyrimidine photo-lyase [Anaerolineales bacterium]|nr:deoxyribodipyrimidine photo-lyase [Anaerolineales bacterium]
MSAAIWWLRRDLRLQDNPALQAAMEHAESVLPVFILDPGLLEGRWRSPKRISFLWNGLRSLDQDLRARGSRLIIRQGPPATELRQLLFESQANKIFAEADYSPYAQQRDLPISQSLPLQLVGGSSVLPPEMVLKPDGQPYTVFTPFSKTWKSLPLPGPGALLSAPERLHTPPEITSAVIPTNADEHSRLAFRAGESEAQARLNWFIQGETAPIYAYAEQRNRPDLDSTSGLSPYLRFGMLSARQAVVYARQALQQAPTTKARQGAETWLNELIWREFYISVLYHFPHVLAGSFRPAYDAIAWRQAPEDFEAWCQGQTGYPIVDAAMRQLSQQGWMHNRLRMIVASFLTKDLLIDWRRGENWFMQHLIDGDPAANNGGWQWCAGTGTDAAPYFRIFNPILQSKKSDPAGSYIRRWVPELTQVPDAYIHVPWEMPVALQRKNNCLIDRDYPAPIVDHALARQRTLDAYGRVRTTTTT